MVNVTNPSHHPLIIQPVLLHHYAKSKSIVGLFSEQFDLNLKFDFSDSQSSPFTFSTEDIITESSMSPVVLQPDDPYQITVTFSPSEVLVADTLLLIRNNLTVFDYVVLRGRGIRDVFSIDGIQPSSNPLMFEFTQQMMERCQGESMAWWEESVCVCVNVWGFPPNKRVVRILSPLKNIEERGIFPRGKSQGPTPMHSSDTIALLFYFCSRLLV